MLDKLFAHGLLFDRDDQGGAIVVNDTPKLGWNKESWPIMLLR